MDKKNLLLEQQPTLSHDSQSRKYNVVVNNPLDIELEEPKDSGIMKKVPFTHDEIKSRLDQLKSVDYWCMSDEIGLEEHTFHTHIFLAAHAPIRFSRIKSLFPTGHIENAYGTCEENRAYVAKSGKWAKTAKSETSVPGSFEEYGAMPVNEKMGKGGKMQFIYDMIQQGLSNSQIMQVLPESILYQDKIDAARQTIIEEYYSDAWRTLTTTYVFGKTNLGKSRDIMEKYGYRNVSRISNYGHFPFDQYQRSNDVIMFEEFNSSINIRQMLVVLDGYPCMLPCRYHHRVAAFTKVFILSNLPLEKQYVDIQRDTPEVWEAFLRRIHKVKHYHVDGSVTVYDSVEKYLKREESFHPVQGEDAAHCPYEQEELKFEDQKEHVK